MMNSSLWPNSVHFVSYMYIFVMTVGKTSLLLRFFYGEPAESIPAVFRYICTTYTTLHPVFNCRPFPLSWYVNHLLRDSITVAIDAYMQCMETS